MTIDADLTGKTAIVTGASSGIGRAIAECMGAAGAHVILSGRTADAMADSATRITESGGRATVVIGDVREPSAIEELSNLIRETGAIPLPRIRDSVRDALLSLGICPGGPTKQG